MANTTMPTEIQRVRQQWRTDIAERDVMFAMHVFHSHRQLAWCLEHLRQHYAIARVVLINDGDGESYEELAAKFQCEYVAGDHLMQLETGHLHLRRMLTHMLTGDETYLFKIDPDTRVWRQFTCLPAFSSMFGTLETITEGCRAEIDVPANVQGGCMGMTRDAAEEMLSSGVLSLENCGVRYMQTWARCLDMHRAAAKREFVDDFALSWAAHACGVPIVECSEIRSRWRRNIENPGNRYAITHPHKLPRGNGDGRPALAELF
jgi:hypothetical protein